MDTSLPAAELIDHLGEGLALFDAQGRLILANPALSRMLGVEVAAGARAQRLCPHEPRFQRLLQRALGGENLRNQDLHYGKPTGERCWLRCHSTSLEEGARTLLSVREISELKRAESEMWQVEKMSALGRLAASVAHEVGNPLSAIAIQLQLLQEDIAAVEGVAPEKLKRRLDIARAEMRRLDGIVQNFLRFSRPPALHLQQVEPNELLRHLFALVEPEAREREIELELDLDESLPPIAADENLLSQALLNILINAFQALGTRPRVRLQSRFMAPQRQILLQISDNGCGIPARDLERIFEFYYTTKDEGTGLGLSIAQRIVRQHGGFLEVDSRAGAGTTVAARLPVEREVSR